MSKRVKVRDFGLKEAHRRVALGYDWLIANGARFDLNPDRIDRETLEMTSDDECALSQAAGVPFGTTLMRLVESGVVSSRQVARQRLPATAWACEHGFLTYSLPRGQGEWDIPEGYLINYIWVTYEELTMAWHEILATKHAEKEVMRLAQ